jgi:Ca2+-binding RTX toxin-like protein
VDYLENNQGGLLYGGPGEDVIRGGPGDDDLWGGGWSQTVSDGADRLYGGTGSDLLADNAYDEYYGNQRVDNAMTRCLVVPEETYSLPQEETTTNTGDGGTTDWDARRSPVVGTILTMTE